MKQGWEIKKLGDVCSKITDGSHNPPKSVLHSDYIMLSSQNIYDDKIFCHNVRYISYDEFCKEDKRTQLQAGDVLLTIVGTIGRCATFNNLKNITLQRSVAVLRPIDSVHSRYLMYGLIATRDVLNEKANGAAQKGIYLKQLSNIELPIPSLAEQERIVGILDKEFERIDALKANAEHNLQHAKDLFQAALRQELQPKEGWYISTLQEMLKLTSGDNLTAKSIINGDYPVYGGNGIMGYHNQYNLDGINVIVGRVGALCGNVRLVEGKIWYTDNAFLVHDKKNIFYLPFLTYELQNANLRQYATQAAQPVVSNASMKDVVLAVPPSIKEQEGIVARLEELNERCKALEENYKKTIALCDDMKQALLRKAFNGEL